MAQTGTTTAAEELAQRWATDPRWKGIERTYAAEEVVRLSGSVREEHTLARRGAERLWRQLHEQDYIHALGALTGGQAVQQVQGRPAGHLPVRLAGRRRRQPGRPHLPRPEPVPGQLRARRWCAGSTTRCCVPTRSPRPRRGADTTDWLAPIVADAEAGFGGPLNAFELTKAMIAAGAAGIHYEDQLASEKKCGHLGGKVLVPTSQHIRTLNAARLAADIADVPTRDRRPHGRTRRQPADQRRGRARRRSSSPASARRRASTGCRTAWPRSSPAASRTRRTPT